MSEIIIIIYSNKLDLVYESRIMDYYTVIYKYKIKNKNIF